MRSTSRPEFPTRSELARKAGVLGGATLLAGGLAHAEAPAASKPSPPAPPQVAAPAAADGAVKPPAPEASVDGTALAKTAPKFKVYREGGGIGPAEDMWQEEEVEAFINWTMAKEGKLNLKTNYAFELDGQKFTIDAFDPEKNVGYEYVDKLDYDSQDVFTKEVRAQLAQWQKDKKVAILFIEVKKKPDAASLKGQILKFLNAVKKAPPAAGAPAQPSPELATPPAPAPAPAATTTAPAKPAAPAPVKAAAPVKK